MKITRLSLLPLLLVAFGLPLRGGAPDEPAPLASFGEPAISPDRSEIAVVSGGDIWTLPFTGGEARLLVSDEANESRPIYSPDGKSLAFISDRTGGGDIYLLTLATGALKQLTFDDGLDRLDGWSRDGKWIYFSSSSRDIAGMNDIFRVSVDGGTPTAVSADRYTSEFFAAPSPDGQTVAFSARGNSAGQWWRRGHAAPRRVRAVAAARRPVAHLRTADRDWRQADVADVDGRRRGRCSSSRIAAAPRTSGRCRSAARLVR